jgi:hypothetical protein
LNAFTSGDFIDFVNAKLQEQGIRKVIPEGHTLEVAYRRATLIGELNSILAEHFDQVKADVAAIKLDPQEIDRKVRDLLRQHPEMCWDEAVGDIVRNR